MNQTDFIGEIMKFLLSVIALCLVMITAKLYIAEAKAEVDGKSFAQLVKDQDFHDAVLYLVDQQCRVKFNGTTDIICYPRD